MKKYIIVLVAASFLATGCKKKYEEGFAAGRADGLVQGRADGETEGYNDGYTQGVSEVYDAGVADGHADGLAQGYSEGEDYFATAGYDEGFSDGYYEGEIEGHQDGYEIGYNSAYNHHYAVNYGIGEDHGYDDGYSDGYSDGSNDGYNDAYNDNYNDGYNSGWSDGYDDGYSAGYGASVNSKNPAVKLAAMVNADLIDYTKLQKFDGRAVSGRLGLSRTSDGSLDMEKLAALKEKHYLVQMSKQLQAKFGLSSERSAKIATVAHQFNKLAGTRELTEKDANTFAVNIIGANLKDIEFAVKKSMKGDGGLLNELLGNIAEHNKTSPENVNRIIHQIFF